MPADRIDRLLDSLGDSKEKLSQFLFIVYYTDPTKDRVRLIVDDGSIKLYISREKFLFLFNELLQPRTMEIEKNYQRIRESLLSYGKWYYYDRMENIFKELLELPEKEKLKPNELFKNTSFIQEKLNEKFVAVTKEYNEKVIDAAPIPKQSKNFINKFYSYFRELKSNKKRSI
jgi:hypothetical protein